MENIDKRATRAVETAEAVAEVAREATSDALATWVEAKRVASWSEDQALGARSDAEHDQELLARTGAERGREGVEETAAEGAVAIEEAIERAEEAEAAAVTAAEAVPAAWEALRAAEVAEVAADEAAD